MEKGQDTPFAELPEALVEEMLSYSEQIGEQLFVSFREIQDNKDTLRGQLQESGYLRKDSELGYPEPPTTCGIDGSYAVERLLAVDLVACAAVAIEGLTPPSEKKYWEKPRHRVFISPTDHDEASGTIIRGIMMEMELELAAIAEQGPDVIFLDYAMPTPLIYMNQAVNKAVENKSSPLFKRIHDGFDLFRSTYKLILESARTDKQWVCLPKYSTNNELGNLLSWPAKYDDRALTTMLLQAGEFTKPIPLNRPESEWHLRAFDGSTDKQFNELLLRVHVIYYKPYNWTPALRIEFSPAIATNDARIAVILQAIRFQSSTPGIFEPYPLYIADRMVKHLSTAIPAFRQTATCKMAELQTGDIGEIFFNMHGYRTEGGR